jgi:fluoroquinolone transport system permease protein
MLTPALLRAVHWQALLVAAAGSALLLWWRWDAMADPTYAVWVLRSVALLLAVAVAFALDDRTRSTLAAVPTPLSWRATVRLVCVAGPAALVWCAALASVGQRVDGSIPVAAMTLEAVTLAAVVLALSGGLVRWRDVSDPGIVVAPAILGLGLLLPQLPRSIALAVAPGPAWSSAHVRWSVLLVVALAILALSLRDPAARRRVFLRA